MGGPGALSCTFAHRCVAPAEAWPEFNKAGAGTLGARPWELILLCRTCDQNRVFQEEEGLGEGGEGRQVRLR